MYDREKRVGIFDQTMQVCMQEESVRCAVESSIARQSLCWQEDAEPLWQPRYPQPAKRVVSLKRSFAAAKPYACAGKKVCVLNFASSVSPGGGVTRGAQAQEECLCRVSSLYPALSHENVKIFYDRHWEMIRLGTMKRENRDDCIYTPGVVVLREDGGEEDLLAQESRYMVDVITCAAPDLRPDETSQYTPTPQELLALLTARWRRIMAVAAANGAEVLILGAFGCGVFANPPQLVAKAFEQAAAELEYCFETIEFAVYARDEDAPNYRAFAEIVR